MLPFFYNFIFQSNLLIQLKLALFSLCILASSLSFGQITIQYDTLRLGNSILGSIDSLDYNSGDLPTTFDGGRSILSESGLSIGQLSKDYQGFRFQPDVGWRTMKFSALPYVGFSYTFGGNGTQFLEANYAQAFTDSLLLNMSYKRRAGAGFIRNTAFTENDYRLQLEWKTRFYAMQLRGAYLSDTSQHSGGLDSLDVDLGLEFASVNKQDAASKSQVGIVELSNYLNFNPNSKTTLGLLMKHVYQIRDRRYHETDTLYGIYNQVYIDSFSTADKFTLASVSNGAGVYFSRKGAYIDGTLNHTYWKVMNLGNTNDTTEIDLNSSMKWVRNQFNFSNQFHFNILGGFNALTNNFGINYKLPKWEILGSVDFQSFAPEPIKRSYYSNSFTYLQNDLKLQQMLRAHGSIACELQGDTTILQASADFLQMSNSYLFNDSTWEASGQGVTAVQVGLKAKMQFGKFHVQPKLIYTAKANGYIPSFQGYLRLYFKSTIFKAKKLLLVAGVEGSYFSSFNNRVYTPAMDAFTWYKPSGKTAEMINMHAFTAIEVSTFRFYARFENIGSFWNQPITQEVSDYPLSGSRLRVGITWDFFN